MPGSGGSRLVNPNGPGGAASTIADIMVKPADKQTRCIDCGDYSCCCIPIPCCVM